MNAKRLLTLSFVLVIVLVVAVGVSAAQGNRGNNGGGRWDDGQNNGQTNTPPNQARQNNNQQRGYQAERGNMANRGPNMSGLHLNLPDGVVDTLPQEIVDLMIDGWMDEQHAYAVYGAIMEQFGTVRPFVNIQRAELQHSSAWETLFDRYGIETPATPTFDLPQYATLAEACAAAVDAEVANFGMYDTMLEQFQPYPDLLHVAQALREVSEFNHLPAFENCATR